MTDASTCVAKNYITTISQNFDAILGNVYADINNNCLNDFGDYNLSNGKNSGLFGLLFRLNEWDLIFRKYHFFYWFL